MYEIDRSAVRVTFKKPFQDWVNGLEDIEEKFELPDLNSEHMVFLVPPIENPNQFDEFVEVAYPTLWALTLGGWTSNEEEWPDKPTRETFEQWFDIKLDSMVVDMVESDIERFDLLDEGDEESEQN